MPNQPGKSPLSFIHLYLNSAICSYVPINFRTTKLSKPFKSITTIEPAPALLVVEAVPIPPISPIAPTTISQPLPPLPINQPLLKTSSFNPLLHDIQPIEPMPLHTKPVLIRPHPRVRINRKLIKNENTCQHLKYVL
jgi:hypothetical protein